MASYYGDWVQASSNSVGKMRMRIDVSYSQNTSKNQSTITIKQYLEAARLKSTYDDNDNVIAWTEQVKLVGDGSSQTKSKYFSWGYGGTAGTQLIQSKTWTKTHNKDGSASFSFSGSCSMSLHTYVSPADQGSQTKTVSIGTKYITLPKINRVSTIKASGNVDFGQKVKFTITRNGSTSTTHTLTYSMGSVSGTIAKDVGTSKEWTVPLSLIKSTPNSRTAKITVTCTTYDGSTKLGTSTCSFIATVPSSYKPTCSFYEEEIYEPSSYSLTQDETYQENKNYYTYNSSSQEYELFENYNVGDPISGDIYEATYMTTGDIVYQNGKTYYKKIDNKYTLLEKGTDYNVGDEIASLFSINENGWKSFIQNITQLQGSIYGQGIEGSTIKSYSISVNGQTFNTQTFLTSALTNAGSNTITAIVTDSRGITSTSISQTFNVIPYSSPTLDAPKCKIERCSENGVLNDNGEYGKITLAYKVASVDDLNTFKIKVYRKDDETIYKEKVGAGYNITTDNVYQNNKKYFKLENEKYKLLIAGKDYEIGAARTGTIYQKNNILPFNGAGDNPDNPLEVPFVFPTYFSGLGQNNSYTFIFRVEDEFSSFQTEKNVSPIFVTMSLKKGGHGVAFGRAAKEDNVLANYMDTKLYAKTWVNDMSIGGFKTIKIRDGSWIIYEEN